MDYETAVDSSSGVLRCAISSGLSIVSILHCIKSCRMFDGISIYLNRDVASFFVGVRSLPVNDDPPPSLLMVGSMSCLRPSCERNFWR